MFQSLQGTIQTQITSRPVMVTFCFNPFKVRSKPKTSVICGGGADTFQSLQGTIQTERCGFAKAMQKRVSIPSRYDPNRTMTGDLDADPAAFQSLQGTIQTNLHESREDTSDRSFNPFKVRSKPRASRERQELQNTSFNPFKVRSKLRQL